MQHQQITPDILITIVRRRLRPLLLTVSGLLILTLLVVLLLPTVYRSSSTILIEDQDIPRDYVQTTITGFAEQRLQAINQRLMSATRLLEIIRQHDLYPDKRNRWTSEELVERMRKDIKFETISADVIDPRSGRPQQATIAFRLSYDGEKPAVVQQIATVLTSLYLEENLKVREAQTKGATKFLEDEMTQVKGQLDDIEARIAGYKQENLNNIPELSAFNLQSLERVEHEIDQLKTRLRSLGEQESYLMSQLSSLPSTSDNDQGRQRLNELRLQLTALLTRVSEQYPDVKKLRAEIAELESGLKVKPGEPSPDAPLPDNPVYLTLSAQLAGVKAEADSARIQLKDFYRKRDDYSRRIDGAPRVEEGYRALAAERENIKAKYVELTSRVMEARVAQGLEQDQMGERFTLIEAASVPEKPVWPNRPAILLIGLVLALGAGVGMVALREFSDKSIHSVDDLARQLRLPVLAAIPQLVTVAELERQRRLRRQVPLVLFALTFGSVLIMHFFVMDLDVFWARAIRKLGI